MIQSTPFPQKSYDLLVVGGGIFGLTAALALQQRGYQTAVLDPGPIPHPLAASTDISKVIRMEYGRDEQYMAMMEQALAGWRRWNEQFPAPLYHETGVTMFTQTPMAAGGFEYESYQMLQQRGHHPERLTGEQIHQRFPNWKLGSFVDGFYHQQGGYAESGRVVTVLAEQAKQAGIELIEGETAVEIVQTEGRATAVGCQSGRTVAAGHILLATGTWTHLLLPELAPMMRSTGHPVFHLKSADPTAFQPPDFVVFTADIARTGWYGFPTHPSAGVVKVANHGVGLQLHPRDDERVVLPQDEQALRTFLAHTFPALAEAPIVYTRRCLYCDTLDGHFWIDRHPEIEGLTVAAGGSGHGFKFAPVLGELIADAVTGQTNPWLPKFAWRQLSGSGSGEEAARFYG